MFDRAASGREAARLLAELRQGDRSVTDFSIEFRTLAAECRWNSEAQWDMFFHGLADYVKDEIYALELPTSLDGLVSLAIRWMPDYSREVSEHAELRRSIGWTTCLPRRRCRFRRTRTHADGQIPSFPGGEAEAA